MAILDIEQGGANDDNKKKIDSSGNKKIDRVKARSEKREERLEKKQTKLKIDSKLQALEGKS